MYPPLARCRHRLRCSSRTSYWRRSWFLAGAGGIAVSGTMARSGLHGDHDSSSSCTRASPQKGVKDFLRGPDGRGHAPPPAAFRCARRHARPRIRRRPGGICFPGSSRMVEQPEDRGCCRAWNGVDGDRHADAGRGAVLGFGSRDRHRHDRAVRDAFGSRTRRLQARLLLREGRRFQVCDDRVG